MKIRSFLAVELADGMAASTAGLIRELASAGPRVNWVDADKIHLTLKFFGEIEELETYEISQAVVKAVEPLQPFPIRVAGLGAFPHLDRPRTIWAGVTAGREPLCQLQARVDTAMGDLGYPCERRQFHPHLTLGRVRDQVGQRELVTALREWQEYECGLAHVDRVILFRSDLYRSGPVYTKLATCHLGASAA